MGFFDLITLFFGAWIVITFVWFYAEAWTHERQTRKRIARLNDRAREIYWLEELYRR